MQCIKIMKNKRWFLNALILILVVTTSCKPLKEIKPETMVENNLIKYEKKPFTSTHVFTAVFKNIQFHTCKGLTALCPKDCGNSGYMANFSVLNYRTHIVNGQAGTEKLDTYTIQLGDFYKKDFDKDYVRFIRKLKQGNEVTMHIDYIYDYTKSAVMTVEKIVSISKN